MISLQSHAEVLNTLDAHPELPVAEQHGSTITDAGNSGEAWIFVASVSPQVRASLAATYGISEKEAGYMIDQFLRGPHGLRSGGTYGSGFTWVVDTNVMREAVLVLTADEVSDSITERAPAADQSELALPNRPILSSACPGWICYAEKTHPFVLPHLSRLKSPQALSGTFFKTVLSKSLGIPPSRIWHLAVMPCFDKKLEASREELTDVSWRSADIQNGADTRQPVRDVDCVITSRELLTLAASRGFSLPSLPLQPLPPAYTPPFPMKGLDFFISSKLSSEQSSETGTSGGYLHNVLKTFQSRNPGSEIVTNQGRNADVVEYILTSQDGQPILKAARYYGFRNIQNMVRKLKPSRASRMPGAKPMVASRRKLMSRNAISGGSGSDYAYVEVMACPGGCTNGGGQIRLEDAREISGNSSVSETLTDGTVSKPSTHEQRAWLARVDEAYFSMDADSEPNPQPLSISEKEARVHEGLRYWSEYMDIPLSKLVYTTYRKVESDVGKDQTHANDAAQVAEIAGKIGGGW